MKYVSQIHNRRSIRLKGYDYSRAGLYFITICTKDRERFFGKIENGKMILNDVGKIANDYWLSIPNHFPNAILHEYIVMPNHLHGIIELQNNGGIPHGVSQPGIIELPNNGGIPHGVSQPGIIELRNNGGITHGVSQPGIIELPNNEGITQGVSQQNQFGKSIGGSVSVIINQYKSSVKRWCNKNNCDYFHWQSRFYEHIIRNEQSCQTISNYIINNPAKCNVDKSFKK